LRRILALDTSTWWGGVALVADEPGSGPVVVAECGLFVRDSHSDRLLQQVEQLLDRAGWLKTEVDAFVATRGPGSFTGIRVGLGTVRGLGLAAGRPCFGVGTLDALAEAHGPAESERVPLIEAGRGELYAGRFDADSRPPRELAPPSVGPLEAIAAAVPAPSVVWIPAPGTRIDAPAGFAGRIADAPRGLAGAAGRIVARTRPSFRLPAPPLAPLYVRPPDVRLKRKR